MIRLAGPYPAGLALGSAGPSITLAASCEVLAFGLGALTPMPAVRNFSICAATAVLLDFILQVGAAVKSHVTSVCYDTLGHCCMLSAVHKFSICEATAVLQVGAVICVT